MSVEHVIAPYARYPTHTAIQTTSKHYSRRSFQSKLCRSPSVASIAETETSLLRVVKIAGLSPTAVLTANKTVRLHLTISSSFRTNFDTVYLTCVDFLNGHDQECKRLGVALKANLKLEVDAKTKRVRWTTKTANAFNGACCSCFWAVKR